MTMQQVFVSSYLQATAQRQLEEFDRDKGLEQPVRFSVSFTNSEKEIGSFAFAPMPGCCGVVVSIHSSLQCRQGKAFHALKEHVARELGYSRMLATTETGNFPELIGAAKAGWKMHPAFTNKRTGHQLTVMEKAL
jgi:hypothetical protein